MYYDYDCISHASLHRYTDTILASCSLWNATLDIPSNAIVSFMFRLFIKYTVSDI